MITEATITAENTVKKTTVRKVWGKTKNGLRFHYPSKMYYVNVKIGGKNLQRVCGTNLESEALLFRDKFLATVRPTGGIDKMRVVTSETTLAPFIAEYRASFALLRSPATVESKTSRLNSLEKNWLAWRGKALASENPKSITVADLTLFTHKLAQSYTSDVVVVFITYLSRILDLVAAEIPSYVPAYKHRGFQPPKKGKSSKLAIKLPSEQQFAAMIAALPTRMTWHCNYTPADLACALAYTGLRIDEARRLRVCHVDLAAGYLVLTEDIVKGGLKRGQLGADEAEARSIPLCPAAVTLFTRLVQGREAADLIFRATADINKQLEAACAKVGCEKLSHHGLRHWFATLALEMTGDAKQVAEWLGHKDGGKLVWSLYGHTRKENEKKLAAKLVFNWTAAA